MYSSSSFILLCLFCYVCIFPNVITLLKALRILLSVRRARNKAPLPRKRWQHFILRSISFSQNRHHICNLMNEMISILEQRTSKSRLTSLVSNLVVTPARLPSWQSEVQRSCLNNGWLWSRASSGLLIPCKHKSILKVEHLKVRTPRWPSHKYDPASRHYTSDNMPGHLRCRGRHELCSVHRTVGSPRFQLRWPRF